MAIFPRIPQITRAERATRQPCSLFIMRSTDESLILVPPPSGRLYLCVSPIFLPLAAGTGILPVRCRPWRASLVKSAVRPGGKWFQPTNSTAYAPPFFSALETLIPFFQAMSDSASASTLVDDDVCYKSHSTSRVEG